MPEAQLADFGSGLTPVTGSSSTCGTPSGGSRREGGARCAFENEYGDPPVEFAQFGINVTVLEPGQTGLYHAESNQEAFLVLSGECGLLVEDSERRLRPWDFFHSSPWTEHAFVGAGEGPCVILMVGSRRGPGVHYPASELAARYGASVAEETPTGGRRTRRSSGSGASDPELGSTALGVDPPGVIREPSRKYACLPRRRRRRMELIAQRTSGRSPFGTEHDARSRGALDGEYDRDVSRRPALEERSMSDNPNWQVARLEDIERRGRDIPVREHLGIRAFGINAYTPGEDGTLIGEHDESGSGQEELYLVLDGDATFEIDGETVDASAGTFVFVRPDARRKATGDGTVLALGATPGEAYQALDWGDAWPFHRDSMIAYGEQRYADALEAVRGGLEHMPDHPGLHYNYACFATLAGDTGDETFGHLRRSVQLHPAFRDQARRDDDLAAVRDDPRFEQALR